MKFNNAMEELYKCQRNIMEYQETEKLDEGFWRRELLWKTNYHVSYSISHNQILLFLFPFI